VYFCDCGTASGIGNRNDTSNGCDSVIGGATNPVRGSSSGRSCVSGKSSDSWNVISCSACSCCSDTSSGIAGAFTLQFNIVVVKTGMTYATSPK
jgi:hypothetical protein